MKFNTTTIAITVIGLLIVGAFLYGGSQGWFNGAMNIIYTPPELNQPPTTDEVCTLSITPSIITKGDSVTGKIQADPRVFCETYGQLGGIWQKIWEGNTDINGVAQDTEVINVAGDFVLKSICGTCITNEVNLKVNDVASSTCDDSDGKNKLTAGHVTADGVSYYDSCAGNWAVIEYYCNGDTMESQVIQCDPGYICVETRSGGYCDLMNDYNVGDVVGSDSGSSSIIAGGQVDVIDMSILDNWNTDGQYNLGVQLNTNWGMMGECSGIQGVEGLKWEFWDSDSLEYQRTDYTPIGQGVQICPVDWDGQTPWRIVVEKTMNIPTCTVNYEWDINVVVC